MQRLVSLTLIPLTVALAARLPAQQATGAITGRVTDAATQRGLADAQVFIVGTPRGGRTNETGEYRIANVGPGTYTIRAQRIGFAPATASATVTANGTATANFALTASAVELDQVVVTATGETQRKRETGNTVATIVPAQDRLSTSPTVADVLQSSAPGVYVNTSGGTQGTASRIRIRGANSVSLSNEPLFIIDGVRANNDIGGAGQIGVGGQTSSRLNDLNPDDIESIEVLKGPAASALYGTAAANGVVQIRTKRGASGSPRWSVHAEGGSQRDVMDYPANYAQIGTRSSGSRTTGCTLDAQARDLCTPIADSLVSFNPLEQASPFRNGVLQSYGASVSGGGDIANYFLSGVTDVDQGVYDPNKFSRTSARANVNGQLRKNITAQISTNYAASRLAFPQNDNNILGIISGGILGSAFDDPQSRGYLAGQTPQEIFAIDWHENVERYIGSGNVSWQPFSWLTATGTGGVDYFDRRNRQTIPPNRVFFGTLPEGQRTANTTDVWDYTGNLSATAAFQLAPALRSTTTLGTQYEKQLVQSVQAFGAKLLAGTGSLQGTAARFNVGETNTDNKTLGALLQEQLAWRDRLFASIAVRTDNNSAFGERFGWITYPAVSLSYVISDEDFFPKNRVLNSLRLRTAYGESGQRPNFRNALTYYNTQTVTEDGVDVPGITVGGTGNPDLKPELSREIEGGFEAGLFDSRIAIEATYFSKKTNDLLIARPLPPSLGLSQTQFVNLGKSSNRGLELLLRGQVLDTRVVKLDVTATAFTLRNRLEALGTLPNGDPIPPIVFGRQRHVEGYPLGGYWDKSVSFEDKNGDGIITRVNCPGQAQVAGGPDCEMTLSDTAVYLGTPQPTREWTLTPRVQLFEWLSVSALFDHKGGYKLYNNTARFQCNFGNCREAYDANAPLINQARNLGQLMGTDGGYVEDATYTKLREVSVTLLASRSMANRLRLDNLSLTLAGRNIATWTDYQGFDPEVNSTPNAGFSTSDFLTQPPLRILTARVNLGF